MVRYPWLSNRIYTQDFIVPIAEHVRTTTQGAMTIFQKLATWGVSSQRRRGNSKIEATQESRWPVLVSRKEERKQEPTERVPGQTGGSRCRLRRSFLSRWFPQWGTVRISKIEKRKVLFCILKLFAFIPVRDGERITRKKETMENCCIMELSLRKKLHTMKK